ncbi:hypothetical protein ACIHIX_10205 [Streptomyces sp. NPDC051913]|uniref:hypothetical protein n=1 Tax=Streptomyces sp. NPDC051913 TaxID=3365676 RepID=UPI0037D8BC70
MGRRGVEQRRFVVRFVLVLLLWFLLLVLRGWLVVWRRVVLRGRRWLRRRQLSGRDLGGTEGG